MAVESAPIAHEFRETLGRVIRRLRAEGGQPPVGQMAVLGYRVFQLGLPMILGAASLLRIRYILAHPPPREVIAERFASVELPGESSD